MNTSLDSLESRWNAQARAFFVQYGNIRFAVSRTGAQLLADGLREAVRCLTVAQATGHEEEDGWIRTDERMPDTRGEIGHSLPVLIYKPHNACCFLAVWAGFYGWQDWTNQSQHAEKEVSHWRSLPESPDGIGEPDGLYKFEETP